MANASFITALGGALSLFLGISLSMVFEVVEFLIDLCLNFFVFFSKSKPEKPGAAVTPAPAVVPWTPGFEYQEPKGGQIE
jgi:hypothetical protein